MPQQDLKWTAVPNQKGTDAPCPECAAKGATPHGSPLPQASTAKATQLPPHMAQPLMHPAPQALPPTTPLAGALPLATPTSPALITPGPFLSARYNPARGCYEPASTTWSSLRVVVASSQAQAAMARVLEFVTTSVGNVTTSERGVVNELAQTLQYAHTLLGSGDCGGALLAVDAALLLLNSGVALRDLPSNLRGILVRGIRDGVRPPLVLCNAPPPPDVEWPTSIGWGLSKEGKEGGSVGVTVTLTDKDPLVTILRDPSDRTQDLKIGLGVVDEVTAPCGTGYLYCGHSTSWERLTANTSTSLMYLISNLHVVYFAPDPDCCTSVKFLQLIFDRRTSGREAEGWRVDAPLGPFYPNQNDPKDEQHPHHTLPGGAQILFDPPGTKVDKTHWDNEGLWEKLPSPLTVTDADFEVWVICTGGKCANKYCGHFSFHVTVTATLDKDSRTVTVEGACTDPKWTPAGENDNRDHLDAALGASESKLTVGVTTAYDISSKKDLTAEQLKEWQEALERTKEALGYLPCECKDE